MKTFTKLLLLQCIDNTIQALKEMKKHLDKFNYIDIDLYDYYEITNHKMNKEIKKYHESNNPKKK